MTPVRRLLIASSIVIFTVSACRTPDSKSRILTVSSPDGKLAVLLAIKTLPQPYLPGKRAYYQVRYQGRSVLLDSPLGLDLFGAKPLDMDLEVVATERQSADSTWENAFGARRTVRDHFNQLTVSLRETRPPERSVDLVFRVFDEGVAFRNAAPGKFVARVFADGPDAFSEGTRWSIETKKLGAGDKLGARLAPGGGLAVILVPVRQ